MVVRLPTLEQINRLGSDFGIVLTAEEAAAFQEAFKGPLASYGRLARRCLGGHGRGRRAARRRYCLEMLPKSLVRFCAL